MGLSDIEVRSHFCWMFICLIVSMSLTGCGSRETLTLGTTSSVKPHDGATKKKSLLVTSDHTVVSALKTSLAPHSTLAKLAIDLDRQARARSSSVQDIAAAQARLNVRQFDRYPQLRPTASAPLTGGGRASFGLNIEQLIWDGGRFSARLTDAELKVAEATLVAWTERNETVFDGLEAFVEVGRISARLREFARLREELLAISKLIQARREGGVADRGEALRVASALHEVERRVIADTSRLREARTDLLRLLPDARWVPSLSDLDAAAHQCQRAWPENEPPRDALARVALLQAEATEKAVRAQRFPKVVLSAGRAYSQSGWSESAVGLQLDASDMLGFGRQGNLQAAAASTRAAAASYALQRENTQAELSRLEADYEGLRADMTALRDLSTQADETIALYKEQLDAGNIPLIEGIVLHSERTDTLISLIDGYSDALVNCLISSRIRGLLAPFGNPNE